MAELINQQGHMVFETKEWELIDLSVEDFNPGRPFKIACNTPGYARVVGSEMRDYGKELTPQVPIFEGFNSYVCSKIYQSDGITSPASGMVALFM